MKKELLFTFLLLITVLLIGTVFYSKVEGWTYLNAAYFSTITLTTIGYGDFSPVTNLGKGFTIIYAFLGVGLMLFILSSVMLNFLFKQQDKFERILKRLKKK